MKKSSKRTLKLGVFTVVLSAVVLAILIALNALFASLPSSITEIDTTEGSLFTVTDETKEIVSSVGEKVEIFMLCEESEESANSQLIGFAKKYCEMNPNISCSTVDPGVDPEFSSNYTDEKLSSGSLIIASDKRSYSVDASEFFMYETSYGQYDQSTYSTYASMGYFTGDDPLKFYGESLITGAIDYVTAGEIPTCYLLEGHNEKELSATFAGYVKDDNVETKSLSLITGDGKIPKDCSMILINDPDYDITKEESEVLSNYFKSGGRILLITYYASFSEEKMPNLSSLTKEMGLEGVTGITVDPSGSYYSQYPIYLVPKVDASTAPLTGKGAGNMTYFFPLSHGIKAVEGSDCSVYSILATSDSAYVKKNYEKLSSFDKDEGDLEGSVMVAAGSSYTGTDEDGNSTEGQFVWFASPSAVEASYDYGGNSTLFIGTLEMMCEKEESVALIGVDVDNSTLSTTSSDVTFWSTVLLFVLPVSVLAAGFAVWMRRRRK